MADTDRGLTYTQMSKIASVLLVISLVGCIPIFIYFKSDLNMLSGIAGWITGCIIMKVYYLYKVSNEEEHHAVC